MPTDPFSIAKTRSWVFEPDDINFVLDMLDRRCTDQRVTMQDCCLALQVKREENRFFDGYERALMDIASELRKLRGIE